MASRDSVQAPRGSVFHIEADKGKISMSRRQTLSEPPASTVNHEVRWIQANSPRGLGGLFNALRRELRNGLNVVAPELQTESHVRYRVIDAFQVSQSKDGERKQGHMGMVTLYGNGKTACLIKLTPYYPAAAETLFTALDEAVASYLSAQTTGVEIIVSEKEPLLPAQKASK
jgi:hypothetical protein